MRDDYSDIIDLPRHRSDEHTRMRQEDRAAQFAPFAALVGFDRIIRETAERHVSKIDEKPCSEFDD